MKRNSTLAFIKGLFSFNNNTDSIEKTQVTIPEPSPKWEEKDGIIYFEVTSDGTTGPEWTNRIYQKGFRLGSFIKPHGGLLHSDDFKPTTGITTRVAVLKGQLFDDSNRDLEHIAAASAGHNFTIPCAEIACLAREKFTDQELKAMGLEYMFIMHEPIIASNGNSYQLCLDTSIVGKFISGYEVDRGPEVVFSEGCGFAYVLYETTD